MVMKSSQQISLMASVAFTLSLLLLFFSEVSHSLVMVKSMDIGRTITQTENITIARAGDIHCEEQIHVNQGPGNPLPNGIPTYIVQIINSCMDCSVSNLHLYCGSFASVRLIDPKLFKRIAINDCLVNAGNPLPPLKFLSFTYANSFPYELKVASATCSK